MVAISTATTAITDTSPRSSAALVAVPLLRLMVGLGVGDTVELGVGVPPLSAYIMPLLPLTSSAPPAPRTGGEANVTPGTEKFHSSAPAVVMPITPEAVDV